MPTGCWHILLTFKKFIIMEEQIKNWYRNNNNHDLDDRLFYDIVIASVDEKIEHDVFYAALHEVNPDITEDEMSSIYSRYEDLRSLLVYYSEQSVQNE